ncbi:uncharacterized protein LOC131239761 isoform X2 [Magnolia sinica]|uniref:uncharacterized protein LOC131239761 isoform X2 n=1 Tax=Magnolia sinica TaxID=86752 RepID=UPI00265A49A6|nr:uncharacterized protein LOC131239761 isoform X2 [Magnolia sinica]XP_058093602.1 uncharacterized protein LOC131239761 isoform X2 [Magnolia sinica]
MGIRRHLHLLTIPIRTMYSDQGRKPTGSTQEGCKGGRTMFSPLKGFARKCVPVSDHNFFRGKRRREVMESEVNLQRIHELPPALLMPSLDLDVGIYSRHFHEPLGTCTNMIPEADNPHFTDGLMEHEKPMALELVFSRSGAHEDIFSIFNVFVQL